jgi:hypothetical protein
LIPSAIGPILITVVGLWEKVATGVVLLVLALPSAAAGAAPGGLIQPSSLLQSQPASSTAPLPVPPSTRAHAPVVPAPELLRQGKAGAAQTRAPAAAAPTTIAPKAVVASGRNQPGLGATDNSAGNQGSPPDTTAAIGLNHYLEFVNSKVGVYSRASLGLVTSADLDVFVGRAGENVFDPQIQWDQQGGRWLYVADDVDALNRNYLAFGWSKTADPSDLTGGWCKFRISTDVGNTKFLEDYPKLGHDDQHIIFGTNSTRGSSFFTAHVYSLPKPANGDTSCPASPPTASVFGSQATPLTTSDGTTAFTPVPANTADSVAAGYVVAADAPYFVASPSQVMAWHVGGTATAPTLLPDGNMNVSAFAFPANVPQPSTSNVLDSADARLTQAVAHADPLAGGAEAVWTQHTVDGPGGRSVVRWYELLPASLAVRQQGTIQNGSLFVFNGAISPAFDGTTGAINYNTGSSSQLADIRAQSRAGGTALNQMTGEVVLGTSNAIDQDFSCTAPNGPPCRWGDYAGASPDPVEIQSVWGSNQLNGPTTTNPAWITRNFQLVDALAGYVRPKGASPMRVSLVPAFNACAAPNRAHGAPLVNPSCAPPDQASSFLTVGTPDANGLAVQALASAQLTTIVGDPSTPADEADVALSASSTDVRLRSGLGDYAGELQARIALQITDRASGTGGDEPATVQSIDFRFAVPCATTVSPSVGSTCGVNTTADALAPGTVKEGARTMWQLGQVQLYDGGADGVASTEPNTRFETQGVFVP